MSKNTQLLYNADKDSVDQIIKDTEDNSIYFNDIAMRNANSATEELDAMMEECIKYINDTDCSTHDLERCLLNLTNMVYFMYEKLEKLSVYEDLAVANSKQKYNNEYLSYQIKDVTDKKNKTTVAETAAYAEKQVIYESVMANIYGHTQSLVKNKIDSAIRMIDSLKKVISHRMQEENLSSFMANRQSAVKQPLMENF